MEKRVGWIREKHPSRGKTPVTRGLRDFTAAVWVLRVPPSFAKEGKNKRESVAKKGAETRIVGRGIPDAPCGKSGQT